MKGKCQYCNGTRPQGKGYCGPAYGMGMCGYPTAYTTWYGEFKEPEPKGEEENGFKTTLTMTYEGAK